MYKEKPFIYLFKTIKEYYFFDVNTCSIVRVNEPVYSFLESFMQNDLPKSDICITDDIHKQVESLMAKEFLKPNDEGIQIDHPANNLIDRYLGENLGILTLQLTQNCNLRCKYCVYSGSYTNRTHTNKRMNFETAKRAIDFYHARSISNNIATVGLYGGEPLLEMELIEKIIDYTEKLFLGKTIMFNLTTNATLLDDEIVRLLSKHNVNIIISLDGPRNIHDNGRVFADNNKGTFDIIMNKLERIKETNPEFMERISFNAVLDTSNDFSCTSNFYANYEFVKDAVVTSSTVSDRSSKGQITFAQSFYYNSSYEMFKYFLYCVRRLEKKDISRLIMPQGELLKVNVHDRITNYYRRTKTIHPSGPCIAGATRLFVTTDGEFYPCERVSETCNTFNIGNLDDGFNVDNVKKLMNIGKITEEECKNCWAIDFCNSCAAGIEDGDILSKSKRLERCESIKKNTAEMFKEYCTLREYGYKFEDFFVGESD